MLQRTLGVLGVGRLGLIPPHITATYCFSVIYQHAGRDASDAYNEIHSPSLLPQTLGHAKHIGTLDKTNVSTDWHRPPPTATPQLKIDEKPPLETIVNAKDFEEIALRTVSAKTWAFYSSAATDMLTHQANRACLDAVQFRPRLMRNVSTISVRTRLLGSDVSLPLFVSPAALAKLVHPQGEKAIARACGSQGIIQAISNNASFSADEIVSHTPENHPSIFQLYVNRDRSKSETQLKQILSLRPRIKAIMITIDAPVPGKREADERLKADANISSPNSGAQAGNDQRGGGLGRIMGNYIDAGLSWEDVSWVRSVVGDDMALFVKGVQSAADAKLALDYGLQGVVVSNHGGRGLDSSPPAVVTLLECHRFAPEIFGKLEVWVDGGVRRGTDILKLLCLGANAVGIGRAALYAVNYGPEGVEHLIEILKDELETSMRLVGATQIEHIWPGLVHTGRLEAAGWVPTVPQGHDLAHWPRGLIENVRSRL